MQEKESRNSKFLREQEKMGSISRHGLFTQPVSLAVGDVAYVAPKRKRDKDGKIPTGPKLFYTSKMKHGQSDQALFSKPYYNCIDDPYDEPWKSFQLRSSSNQSRSKSKQRPFTAGGNAKQNEPKSFLK